MRFFRSEDDVHEWCRQRNLSPRPLVSIDQLWSLAVAWYATRLQPEARRPQTAEMRQIFSELGLEGDFWDPQSDSFA